ncbi:MAG: hypothetical protein H6695_01545 [Deferribacteres bacterium]|nr:hypothetical protein [Deferribacteres bacterium]
MNQGSYSLNFIAKENSFRGINHSFELPKKENLFEFSEFAIIYEKIQADTVFDWHLLVFGRQFAKPELLNPNLAPLENYDEHGTLIRMLASDTPNDSTVSATYFYKTANGNFGRLYGSATYSFFSFDNDSIGVNVDIILNYEVLTDGSRTFPD